uniref:Oxidoreductase n=1 Tax=Gongylonema pulchrum TaxID=637853 RepID=A0A183EKR7_9BILA
LNLYDYFMEQYQKERMSKWKDFVGRTNPKMVPYANLDLNKRAGKGGTDPV